MRKRWLIPLVVLVVAASMFAGCGKSAPSNPATDYSQSGHWLALPASTDMPVDVFYLYPTSYAKTSASDPQVCAIDNPAMIHNSGLAFQRQATAFQTVANIFAPYYRQTDVSALSPPLDQQQQIIGDIPTTDATAAFDYFIKHYNNGRPFILASHSQGSNVMINLLSGYMHDHPDVYSRMVAAYVIGYSVTLDYLAQNPQLKFAQGPDDTGVLISYNTEAPDETGNSPVVLPGAQAINPITWTRSETLATAAQNLGSIQLNPDGSVVLDAQGQFAVIQNYADARVDTAKGVVICSTADENKLAPGNAIFPRGVYHSFDYPFYYFNIRANAALRTAAFLNR